LVFPIALKFCLFTLIHIVSSRSSPLLSRNGSNAEARRPWALESIPDKEPVSSTALAMRLPVLVPVVCYIIAFVLALLCLFAGHKKGFMEDYAVVRLNTSALGYNLVDNVFTFDIGDDNNSSNDNDNDSLLDDLLDGAKDVLDDVADSIQDWANDVGNGIADRLADELGVSEWYSAHVMAACQGGFTPNATAPDAGYNVTDCTGSAIGYEFNLTALIDHDLRIGPARLNLAAIGFPDSVQYAMNLANGAIKAAAILYAVGAGLAGLGLVLSAGTLAFDRRAAPLRRLATANLVVAVLAALALVGVSVAVTVGAGKMADKINEEGAEYGLVAVRGAGFLALSWTAFAFAAVAAAFYVLDLVKAVRGRKRINEKGMP
jgi:hypothetical protein